jgi:hypothetical protein
MRLIPTGEMATLGDYRRYPGCRLQIACAACGYAKAYLPERVIARLHQLKAGGYPTTLVKIAARVGKPCYRCRHAKWIAQFAWPDGMDEREIRRLANLYRN